MKIEKKLIALSLLSVLIGAAAIMPLFFLTPATASETNEGYTPKPLFFLNLPYAYWTENSPGEMANEHHMIIINYTSTLSAENDFALAQIEYFQLECYSDKGPISNMSFFIATNGTSPFDLEAHRSFQFSSDTFGSKTTGGGVFFTIGKANDKQNPFLAYGCPHVFPIGGGSSGNSENQRQTAAAVRDANTIFIDVRRLGYVTFNGDSTTVTVASDEVVEHIELNKSGDGFLYNAMFSEEVLSKIDLLSPAKSLLQLET